MFVFNYSSLNITVIETLLSISIEIEEKYSIV